MTDKPYQHILKLDKVTVELGGDIILNEISMNVLPQETIVLVGPSGGGKTVLLKTLAGIIAPKSGHVFCEGEDWQNLQTEDKRRLAREVGVQFQKSGLFDSMSTFDNVAFPLREHFPDMPASEVEERVRTCLTDVDLWEARRLQPFELSGGMQLRLGVARALAMEPKIIFYDDPTAGLDPVNTDKMLKLIIELKEKNESTLIVTTHSMDIAYHLAGRIFLVCNQEIIECGGAEETKKHPEPRVQQFIHGRLEGPLQWG